MILKQINQHFESIEIGLKSLTNEIKELRQENDFNEFNLNDLRNQLKQLNNPVNISLREENSSSSFISKIYVADALNHRIVAWRKYATCGEIIAGGNGCENGLNQFNEPHFMFVDQDDTFYVSDLRNHRVMKWLKDAKQGSIVVGGNNRGNQSKQLHCPIGLSFDNENNLGGGIQRQDGAEASPEF